MPRTQTLPDLARPDVDVAVVSSWAAPERQRAAVEEAAAERESAPWPDGLLSVSYFVSFDDDKVATYAQWASEDAVTGLDGPEPIVYRLARGGQMTGETRVPGCIVFVEVESEDAELARSWVDSVFVALDSETEPHPGGISAHFHVSTDGKHVLNYAAWTDPEAHRKAVGDPAAPGVAKTMSPEWHRVQNTPGITPIGFTRYGLALTLTPPKA
jgi:hypothetical protein